MNNEQQTDAVAVAWGTRADELADWALARLFVRTDRFGGYYVDRKTGATKKTSRPKKATPSAVTRPLLVRHFQAKTVDDVVGAYSLAPGTSTGRAAFADIDAHDPEDDPVQNKKYAEHLYQKLAACGFRPFAADYGEGSFHVGALFNTDVGGAALQAFGAWLVSDAVEFGMRKDVERFPKQAAVAEDRFGNWLRLVGRHHKRDVWAKVFDGSTWLEGEAAVAHVLSLTGDAPDLIPSGAKPVKRTEATKTKCGAPSMSGRASKRGAGGRRDVFPEFNQSRTVEDVAAWHEAKGHRVLSRSADRVDFTRAGKDGVEESFNVKLIGGVPITFNFSSNSGLRADGRGMNPAQVRCLYEFGAVTSENMKRLAAVLKRELGWPEEPAVRFEANAGTSSDAPTAPGDPEPPAAGQGPRERFKDTDLANASRFVADHGSSVMFVADWRRWVVYDGARWAEDRSGALVAGFAHRTVRRMAEEAAERVGAAAKLAAAAECEKDEAAAEKALAGARRELEWAKKSQDTKRIAAMLEASKPYLHVAFGRDVFDTAPHLLNVANGTVDLRTGELRPHDRGDFLTKIAPTPYKPGAPAPAYLEFLNRSLGSADVVDYVRRLSGYAVTGDVSSQTLHLFHGRGSNGKNVLLDLWLKVLGEIAATVPPELIADLGGDRHPTEKTVLRGRRLAVAEETGDEEALNAKRVKQLTGGGDIVARGMGQDFYAFPPTHKLIVSTNCLPRVKVNDHATWRRIRLVNFPHVFWTDADRLADPDGGNPEKYPDDRKADPNLPDRLLAEAEGVLADMVAHATAFYAAGRLLDPPAEVMKNVVAYRKTEDVFGRWCDDYLRAQEFSEGRGERGSALLKSFTAWYIAEVDPDDEHRPSSWMFYQRLRERFKSRVLNGLNVYAVKMVRPTGCEDEETPTSEVA